eukprot:CCRYP_010410-RA/>CCRYP_010410-RA protein AED:0.12 eAED:0.12 QI:0/0/0/0.5/0/0/2/0/1280
MEAGVDCSIAASLPSKTTMKWIRRVDRWRMRRTNKSADEALLDSGATSSFVQSAKDVQLTGTSNKLVRAADGGLMPAHSTGLLTLSTLRKGAREALVVPGLKTQALMSVSPLANNGYTTIFHPYQQGVTVHDADSFRLTVTSPPVLQGCRNTAGLWTVPLTDDATISRSHLVDEAALSVYDLPSTKEVVRFLHAALGFPTKATLLTAAQNGNLVTFPGLTPDNINKHFPESEETQKGHMRQTRQGVRSTKVPDEDAVLETKPKPGVKHKDAYLRVFDATRKTMYTDQSGPFPRKSRRNNQYIMIAVELDGNYIDAEPLQTRKAKALTDAYQRIYQRWKATGVVCPNWHVLDNEAPAELKQAIRENNCRVELTPPDMHRRNIAERGMQTFKGHFKAILAGVSDDFPIREWDELIPQTVLTLNLLRQSNVAPNISAYAYHHGSFDYNRMPLAPMGCAVQFHIKPDKRKTWGEHSMDGWYLRTSPEHYRCHVVFVKKTQSKRVTDTVFFKHKYITQPEVKPADVIVKAYRDLRAALQGIKNTADSKQMQALEDIQEQLSPGNKLQIEQQLQRRLARVDSSNRAVLPSQPDQQHPRVQIQEQQHPRVRFEEPNTNTSKPTTRMIVASPREQVVASPQKPITKPTSILNAPKYTEREDSIAARIKARRAAPVTAPKVVKADDESIAERLLRRKRQNKQVEAALPVLDPETGQLLEYRQLLRHPKFKEAWNISAANEFGRLAQGIKGRVKATDTIKFIRKSDIPYDRLKDVTYIKFVCQVRTEKSEPNRTRATFGGNLIHYPDDVGTPTADLLLIKIFLNSVISTDGARFATADLSNFYLCTPMPRPEFGRVKLSDIPEEIIVEYKLREIATPDEWVYFRADKTHYGLPQAGSLSHDLLEKRLNQEGYFKSLVVPGLWKHKTRNIQFVLVVDDFGIKYVKRDDLDHLVAVLRRYYDVSVDIDGKEFVKIELDWDYKKQEVHLSMEPYLRKALRQFDNVVPTKRQDSPYPHVEPKYGAKVQFAEYDTSPVVGKEGQTHIQKVNGKFLWYGRAVDPTTLVPLSALASQQSKPTQHTLVKAQHFLDYMAMQEPAVLTYRKSDMILAVHSDAGYLNEDNARSRIGGHHFLSEDVPLPPNNGAIHNVAEIIKAVMSSAAEAETGALYINARKAVEIRNILNELGHKQPPTPIQTDNSTAEGIVNNRLQPKRTKAMDMRFHWLRDRANQKQFRFYWRPGTTNRGDYFTKHHPAAHHRNMRPELLTPHKVLVALRKMHNMSGGRAVSTTARVC